MSNFQKKLWFLFQDFIHFSHRHLYIWFQDFYVFYWLFRNVIYSKSYFFGTIYSKIQTIQNAYCRRNSPPQIYQNVIPRSEILESIYAQNFTIYINLKFYILEFIYDSRSGPSAVKKKQIFQDLQQKNKMSHKLNKWLKSQNKKELVP